MSLESLMVHDLTVVSAGTVTDDYGNVTKDWAAGSSVETKGWVTQRTSVELRDDRETTVSQWVAYLPASVTVRAADRVEWGDYVFEVDGNPLPAWSPRGHHHTEAALTVADG